MIVMLGGSVIKYLSMFDAWAVVICGAIYYAHFTEFMIQVNNSIPGHKCMLRFVGRL